MPIDSLSLQTTPIILYKNSMAISQGTGFFFGYQDEKVKCVFLVTNYHVLTGHSPTEKQEPLGDVITFQIHSSGDDPSQTKVYSRHLYTNGCPNWFVNHKCPEADLAILALPGNSFDGIPRAFCSSKEYIDANLRIRPSSPITLIGYPYGYYDTKNNLPVWKTGNIASEPQVNFEGNPLLLVDVAAFPGMSGSPVYGISYGMYEREDGAVSPGGIRKLIGIYASMQMRNEKIYLEQMANYNSAFGITNRESLQIGHVWKASLIYETVREAVESILNCPTQQLE